METRMQSTNISIITIDMGLERWYILRFHYLLTMLAENFLIHILHFYNCAMRQLEENLHLNTLTFKYSLLNVTIFLKS